MDLLMEVGVAAVDDPEPKLQVKYSRDGGRTYKSKRDVVFGEQGDYQRKVRRHQFGRTKENFSFVLKFILTDAVPFYVYKLFLKIIKGS